MIIETHSIWEYCHYKIFKICCVR